MDEIKKENGKKIFLGICIGCIIVGLIVCFGLAYNNIKTTVEGMKTENSKLRRKNSDLILSHNNKIYGLKDKLRCFFCGGKNCKHENFLNNINNNNAIIGLN